MIYCPRCGTGNEDRDSKCSSCEFGLGQVKSLLNGDGGRLFLRIAITLVLFFSVPFVYFWLGRYWDLNRFEFIAGFLLVLLLPGLPWAVSAIFNRLTPGR